MSTHRVYRLRHRPIGQIADTDLELVTEPKPTPGPAQCLVKNLFFSIDPTHRIWMSDRPQYMEPVALNDIMRSSSVGVVEESNVPDYPVGTHVLGFGGIAEYYIGIPGVTILWKAGIYPELPLTADLSVLSPIIGLTAWHGVNKILGVKAGDVVVVSGAAGAVGSLVGQLSKLKGATVIGIAGTESKCRWLTEDLRFDHAINYKTQDVGEALKAAAPEGVTHYFDNVGGAITDTVFSNLRLFAKVCFCGAISEYDRADAWDGQKNFNMLLMKRVTLTGFICLDHLNEYEECRNELLQFVHDGKIKYSEDVRDGIENYISTLRLLAAGTNTGKLILKV